MRRNFIISYTSIALVIAIALCTWFYSSNIIAQIPITQNKKVYQGVQWEYKVVYLITGMNWKQTQKKYNELGKDGWELVNWRDDVSIFKRQTNSSVSLP